MRPSFLWGIRVVGAVVVTSIALMLVDSFRGDTPNGLAVTINLLPAITFCIVTVIVLELGRLFALLIRR